MKIKINKPIFGHKVGQIIDIKVNDKNIPLAIYWRRRLKDAEIDNCIEIVEEKKQEVEITEVKMSKSEGKMKKMQRD